MQENISIVKDKCFGCRSCEQVCPKKCIDIKPNEEGFLYPLVEESVCIHCGLCVKSCPAENPDVHRNHPSELYGLKNKDEKAIMRSASGGASDAAAKVILAEGGVIFGAAYDENLRVSHIEVNKIDDLYKNSIIQVCAVKCCRLLFKSKKTPPRRTKGAFYWHSMSDRWTLRIS